MKKKIFGLNNTRFRHDLELTIDITFLTSMIPLVIDKFEIHVRIK